MVVDAARFEGRGKRRAGEMVPLRSPSNPAGPEPVDSLTPSRVLAPKEELVRLLEQLDALPENYRRVIVMAKVEDLTTREIAERLGKPREAVLSPAPPRSRAAAQGRDERGQR